MPPTRQANAPGVRGCSALRARADMFVAPCLGHAKTVVGAPDLRSMRESRAAMLHSRPARLRAGWGTAQGERYLSSWQLRSRSRAVESKKLFPGKLMPHSRACPATGSDRGKRDLTLFVRLQLTLSEAFCPLCRLPSVCPAWTPWFRLSWLSSPNAGVPSCNWADSLRSTSRPLFLS